MAEAPTASVVVLDRGNNTSVTVHLHGATVTSWKCLGQEMLFMSDNAVFDNKKAIRGGIPIVFPQFGPWSRGPQHGFARTSQWRLELPPTKHKNGNVLAIFSLEDNEVSRQMWNNKFKIVYTLLLEEATFQMNLVVHNKGTNSFEFTCLLHNYFATPSVVNTGIIGLEGIKYIDKVNDGAEGIEQNEVLSVGENYDRIYRGAPSEIVITNLWQKRNIVLRTFNLPDIVLWNPWQDKAKQMSDFGDTEYRCMICVESGNVCDDIVLTPGGSFECYQTFTAIDAPS